MTKYIVKNIKNGSYLALPIEDGTQIITRTREKDAYRFRLADHAEMAAAMLNKINKKTEWRAVEALVNTIKIDGVNYPTERSNTDIINFVTGRK